MKYNISAYIGMCIAIPILAILYLKERKRSNISWSDYKKVYLGE